MSLIFRRGDHKSAAACEAQGGKRLDRGAANRKSGVDKTRAYRLAVSKNRRRHVKFLFAQRSGE